MPRYPGYSAPSARRAPVRERRRRPHRPAVQRNHPIVFVPRGHTARVLSGYFDAPGRPLPVGAWLAVPVLFATAVLGLVAVLGVLIDAQWQATMSSALCGAAAAVTALIDVHPEHWPRRRRRGVRIAYPTAIFVTGLVFGGFAVPTWLAIAIGLPALVTLVIMCRQAGANRAEVSRR